eukprot:9998277-Alexandrium_andersonii.AAC.1
MSASLVGSEMCIRDSSETSIPKRHMCPTAVSARGSLSSSCVLGRPHAVSYTHLTLPTICSV